MAVSIQDIDAVLPQTQCTKCGYDGCLPYAQAISEGAPHNQCPPGGQAGVEKLSKLLDREVLTLNPENGVEALKKVAVIREDECIGCKKCILACPVDAIVGSGKLMHTVISDICTGCDLCVEPCPMDCIDMVDVAEDKQPQNLSEAEKVSIADTYRLNYQIHQARLNQDANKERQTHLKNKRAGASADQSAVDAKKAFIQAAIERAKAKKQ